jgi:hypothetical protein
MNKPSTQSRNWMKTVHIYTAACKLCTYISCHAFLHAKANHLQCQKRGGKRYATLFKYGHTHIYIVKAQTSM